MMNKIINIALKVIIFLVPILVLPVETHIDQCDNKHILKVIALGICGIILLVSLIIKRKELKFDKIDYTLIIFYGLILLSTIFSIDKIEAIFGNRNRFEGILAFTVYFLTYYCAKYYFEYDKKIKYYIVAVAIITSVIGILQYYNIFPLKSIESRENFASSTFGNRNFFGAFLSIMLPMSIALYIVKQKKIYLITSYFLFFAILVALTRSAWIGLGFATIIGICYIIKNFNKEILKRVFYLVIGFVVIFVFVLISPKFLNNRITNYNLLSTRLGLMENEVTKLVNMEDTSRLGAGRVQIWGITLKVIEKFPLLGTGPDTLNKAIFYNFTYEAIEYYKTTGTSIDKAHNEYLQIAATIGLPALVAYLTFISQILLKQKDILKNGTTLILTIPIISYLVQAFFNISVIDIAPIYYFLLGIIQNEKFREDIGKIA